MTTVALPQFTDSVDLRYFVEPLGDMAQPVNYLDRFPDAIYNKAPDSHFYRFMYVLLGPVGVGWLKLNLLTARLRLEASGATLGDLEAFYGDPFAFGRILDEAYDDDVSGLLPASVWSQIRAQDEAYRSRALQFLRAAQLGTSPKGMQLAAQSGTGQNVELVENYRFLFDAHSDDVLGLPAFGQTYGLGEFIVVPRPEVSRSSQQRISFATASVPLGANTWKATFNGYATSSLSPTADAATVQTALQALPTIGTSNVVVIGGPAPGDLILTFTGTLANQALPTLKVSFVAGGNTIQVPVLVATGGVDPPSEVATIGPADRHATQVALDRLRPVASFPTFAQARSHLALQPWSNVAATTESTQVVRYVTGSPSIAWPPIDSTHWIESAIENEAPRLHGDTPQHYVGFHNVSVITAYTDDALQDVSYATNSSILAKYNSVHVGPFPEMTAVLPYFAQFTNPLLVCSADRSLADYAEPLNVSALAADGTAFINGTYPADYTSLQGVPTLKYHDDHFWSSRGRPAGAEILEIDLGSVQAVNYITMEISRKPLTIEVDYDLVDQSPRRSFVPVTPVAGFPAANNIYFDPNEQNPWVHLELYFGDGLNTMVFTRFIRLILTRRADSTTFGRFLFDTVTQTQTPWSVDVRNLRLGRNVAPTVV